MKKKTRHSTLSNTLFALKWHFKISPAYTLYIIFNSVLGDVITTFEHTFLTAYIISCVENRRPIKEILYFLIPVAIAVAIKIIQFPIISRYAGPRFYAKFKKSVNLTLYKKAVNMEISKYDNSEFYNDFVFAMQQAPNHITQTVWELSAVISSVVVAVITGSFMLTADKMTLLITAIVLPLGIIIPRIINKLCIKREEELVPQRRKRDYVNRIFYLADFVKDIKTGNISSKLKRDFKDSTEEMENTVDKYGKKIVALEVVNNSIVDIITDGLFLLYLFYQALVKSRYGLGVLLGLYNSANRFINQTYRLSHRLPAFQNHSLYIEKMRTFLDTENEMADDGALQIEKHGDIVLENVEFTYSGNDKPTLNGISMKIKKGEKIALVGYNGAGKSTLIKLLLRLYDPTSGSIRYGEQDIRDYPIDEYRKRFGVLFQDFEMIATTIEKNISMSEDTFNKEKADEVVKKVAFAEKLASLKKGYDTELTKEFSDSGVNLSGGESQKIALARVLYSSSDVIILDEPSSALDPIAEYELNKAVTELSGEKTVIIISHRLSTTRFVDKIYMFEDGKIVEEGNHNHLLEQNGKYAQMFLKQAEKYVS